MAAGNKKKKKGAANPARGFATTSIQSKSKIDEAKETTSTEASGVATPDSIPVGEKTSGSHEQAVEKQLHELSPEELEAQLEKSALQDFVETHASRVKKEASRQVSRLRADKRVLRGQADWLSTKQWLPDELMQDVLDLVCSDFDLDHSRAKDQILPSGDDLVAKIWTLRLILLELEVPLTRVSEVVTYLLNHPPPRESPAQAWGTLEALDWLALNALPEDSLDYENQKKREVNESEGDESHHASHEQSEDNAERIPEKHDTPKKQAHDEHDDGSEVSDADSDLEPEQLIPSYLRAKEKLFRINPAAEDDPAKKNSAKSIASLSVMGDANNVQQRKLQRRLRKIESDALFDDREAAAQWAPRRVLLLQDVSQRKEVDVPNGEVPEAKSSRGTHSDVHVKSETQGDTSDMEDTDILSGIFESLPGPSNPEMGGRIQGSGSVHIRDFGRVSGTLPRRVLEDACRSRDSRCEIVYKQVSPTVYACRHSVSISWTKEQEILQLYPQSIEVRSKPRQLTVTMIEEATPDALQSESYVATVALFLIFSGSPKEEKAHLRLPPAFRDLFHELSEQKRQSNDASDRETIKEIRSMIEKFTENEDGFDDEVVFNVSNRRLNGSTNGASTPTSRPDTPGPEEPQVSQALKDMWAKKVSMPSYQRMLLSRTELPMFRSRDIAMEAIDKNQVTIIVGDTGSGKSTQVPQFILEHELSQGRQCKIYVTEPRRISAISLAQRVSEELGEQKHDLGTARSLVGYAIRLESQAVFQTKLVYATVGIVLRMLEGENGLNEVSHLTLDEVHERSIDTDFLLIVLKSLLRKRPELKVVLMSATVDAQKFSQYLYGAPIVTVEGRTFPVQSLFLEDAIEITGYGNDEAREDLDEEEIEGEGDHQDRSQLSKYLKEYSPRTRATLSNFDEYKIHSALIVKILEVVAYHPDYKDVSKAILIFVPGIQEIKQLNDILLGHPSFSQGWRVHALHSTFASEEQQSAFVIPQQGIRKIVIATNIAETGITIPDITCVIDTGKHREMQFDERRQMSRLTQSFIAQANAKQRRGRAGRVQQGICFHLFTKYRYEEMMAEQQRPEMLRLSLQDLVMRVKICKLGQIEAVLSEALDPPSSKNIRRSIDALIEVGALTDDEQLTALGTQLAKLPLDAQLGKLILYGACFGCLDFALTVTASLTSKSPFLSPMHAKKQADSVRLGFKRGDSDLLTLYNAYKSWRKVCNTPGLSEYHFCNKSFLSSQNLANIEELKRQLFTSLIDSKFVVVDSNAKAALTRSKPGYGRRSFVSIPEKYCTADENDMIISSAVAWSFYPKIVRRDGKGWRNVANNQSLALHPTSVNKSGLLPDIKYLSFYSIMQSSSKFTNAQETTSVSDFALVLHAGEAVFHMYAGVIIIDGNRLRFKVKDWRIMLVLRTLRGKIKEALGKQFKYPGRELGDRQRRWMELVHTIFEQRKT